MSAIEKWAVTVRAEHEQSDRFRSAEPTDDHWHKIAHRFAPATREKAFSDETFVAVSRFVGENDTVLDVGAGAGRLAVPLAERCRHVTAVEPSEAMRMRMSEQASAWGVENLSIVDARWEEAKVEPHDVVICAHVIYTAELIESFLRKLTESAKRDVLVVVFDRSAMSNYFQLWQLVYGEDRISLPSLNELRDVLGEMKVDYEAETLPEWESRPFKDFDAALEESKARLFMSDEAVDSAARLREVLEDSLVPVKGGLRFKWATTHRPWLVRWSV